MRKNILKIINRNYWNLHIIQCESVSASSIQEILRCNQKTVKDLETEIALLESWQVISRSQEKTEEFVKFTAEAFFNY